VNLFTDRPIQAGNGESCTYGIQANGRTNFFGDVPDLFHQKDEHKPFGLKQAYTKYGPDKIYSRVHFSILLNNNDEVTELSDPIPITTLPWDEGEFYYRKTTITKKANYCKEIEMVEDLNEVHRPYEGVTVTTVMKISVTTTIQEFIIDPPQITQEPPETEIIDVPQTHTFSYDASFGSIRDDIEVLGDRPRWIKYTEEGEELNVTERIFDRDYVSLDSYTFDPVDGHVVYYSYYVLSGGTNTEIYRTQAVDDPQTPLTIEPTNFGGPEYI